MPRDYEISSAFERAVKLSPSGKLTVTASVFRTELHKRNHDWSLQRCNAWITRNQTFFMDVTEGDGADRTYVLRNMGRVL